MSRTEKNYHFYAYEKNFIKDLLKIREKEIKKIKRIDKYDDVIKNLQKYKEESDGHPHQIIVKYIILKGINDKKEYIEQWINTCADIDIRKFMPLFDFCHQMNEILNSNIDHSIIELYEYSKEKIKTMGPDFILQTHSFLDECYNRVKTKDC